MTSGNDAPRSKKGQAEALTVQLPLYGRSQAAFQGDTGLAAVPTSRTYNVTVEHAGRRLLKQSESSKKIQKARQSLHSAPSSSLNKSSSQWSHASSSSSTEHADELAEDGAILEKHRGTRAFEVTRRFPALVTPRNVPTWAASDTVGGRNAAHSNMSILVRPTFSVRRKRHTRPMDPLLDTSRSTIGEFSIGPVWQPAVGAEAVEQICDRKPALFEDNYDSELQAKKDWQDHQKLSYISDDPLLPTNGTYECNSNRQEMKKYINELRNRGKGINANLKARYNHRRLAYKAEREKRGNTSKFEVSLNAKVKRAEEVKIAEGKAKEQAAPVMENVFGHMKMTFASLRAT